MSGKPGLAKASPLRVLLKKEHAFVRLSEGQMRDWLSAADIMSEGREERTETKLSYFGTTSILLPWAKAVDIRLTYPSALPALASDPHLRVRVLRIARQEAETRASARLDTIRAEISCRGSSRGLLFLVDLEAPVRLAGLDAAR